MHPLSASILPALLSRPVSPLPTLLSGRISAPLIRVYNSPPRAFPPPPTRGGREGPAGLSTGSLSRSGRSTLHARAILSDYFMYGAAARSGAASCLGILGPLRGGREWARRGDLRVVVVVVVVVVAGREGGRGAARRRGGGTCAPTSGSPVAPSRTCRLFPRRDSRSPHLSSVRPALPSISSPPRL